VSVSVAVVTDLLGRERRAAAVAHVQIGPNGQGRRKAPTCHAVIPVSWTMTGSGKD
jgi:hypothetical protein